MAHVTSTGQYDWCVNKETPHGFEGSSSRGALAYDVERNILAQGRNGKVELYTVSYEPTITLTPLHTIASNDLGNNIDGLAFDYAGDLYVVNSSKEKFQKFALPTDENICTVAAPALEAIRSTPVYTVSVASNNNEWGIANGGGTFEEGQTATITAVAATNYEFVNWTKEGAEVSTENSYTFAVTETATYIANFKEITKYTINATANDPAMGSVIGGGIYYEGTEVTLTAKANGGYVFEKWSDDNTDESRTFTAGVDMPETLTANFKVAVPRAWAYDLRLDADTDPANYIFTFKTTSAGTATLIFKDKDGNTQDFGAHTATATEAGEQTITIAKTVFDAATKDIYWSVELAGEAIAKMAEITDPTKGIYDIVAPQGIAVDNNTDSKHFGQVYVAAATDGTVSRGAQTRGIFVYDTILNELNSPNTGYLPANATLTNTTRQAIHRIAVNPTNGHVAFAYNIADATAVWSMDPANLAGNAVNLIASSAITKANSLCYDAEGTLYVMDNANTGTGGKIYKIQNGVGDVFADAQAGNLWAVEDNAMTSDGRGGLWIAQNRWSVDAYPVLSHVNSNGQVDFAVSQNSSAELQALFPYDDNNASYRGQCAYYVAEDILAFAGNKEAVLFKITYDANDVPTNLEKLMSTGKLGVNIDGVAFDYAGDLYVASETTHRFYKFVVPTINNTCTVPAPASQVVKKEQRYTVTVSVNDDAMGTATGGGEYKAGEKVTLTATANKGYQFVNWTIDSDVISTDASFEYTVPAENVTLTAHFEAKPLAMVGIVKRAVQIGESTIVLTHEADGTPHLYKVVDGELEAEISQEGVIARDIDNAGDYLSISDIAATEDGKLVAINKIVCQTEGYVDAGYKRGETRVYIWNELDGVPSLWFTSKMSSNWFRAVQGHTMAYKGTSTNGTLFTTGVTATGVKFRYSVYNVIDGVYTDPAVNDSEYYHFTKGDEQTTDILGANYEISVSPLAENTWVLDGELINPFEITDPLTFNSQVTAGPTLTDDLGKKFNGATYLTVEDKHLMVAPYADANGKVAGVKVIDITNGLAAAQVLETLNLDDPAEATAAATAVLQDEYGLIITLVTDATLHRLEYTTAEVYTRSVTNGDFGTICLPYGSSNMTGAVFYEVAGQEPGKVYLDQVTTLEAGKPYIFRATASTITVVYEGDEALSAGNHNGLYGTFTDNTTVEQGNYIVYNNELRLCGTGCYINAYRAYLNLTAVTSDVPAPMPGRQRIGMNVQGGNETTALDNITEGNGTITPTMEGTYDVLGRKLTQPTTTGVYIINGKKVFVVK